MSNLPNPYQFTDTLDGGPLQGQVINLGALPMTVPVRVGHVSWINNTPNPMSMSVDVLNWNPDWIPKTYMGLSGTSNTPPPDPLADFTSYQAGKNFRSMTYCEFSVKIDGNGKVVSFSVVKALHDAGWTPPFRILDWPFTAPLFWTSVWDTSYQKADCSSLSLVATQARHNNSTITTVPASETVLVNALIKFRAGQHTDDIGINEVHAAYHVPWVWSEFVLTWVEPPSPSMSGQFNMYCRGSILPSHAWYFNDKQVNSVIQAGDSTFPGTQPKLTRDSWGNPKSTPGTIATDQLLIMPVLAKGVPAAQPQQPLSDEAGRTGPVDTHLYAVTGNPVWSKQVASVSRGANGAPVWT